MTHTIITSFEDPRAHSLRQTVRAALQNEVMTQGERWEKEGTIPKEVYQFLGKQGLLGLCHSTELGGTDLGPIGSVIFAEEISRTTYSGLAEAILVHTDMSSTHILQRGNNQQQQRYAAGLINGNLTCGIAVTEEGAGSDVASIQTHAKRCEGGWQLNGSKIYVTNGLYGDVFVVLARTKSDEKPSRAMSLFIVEKNTPGLIIRAMDKKHGMLSSDIAELVFDNTFISDEYLLGEENKGFYSIMANFQNERLVLGGMSVGMAKSALDISLKFLKQREIFGKTLWDLQANQHRIAMLASRLEAVSAFVAQTAQRYANGEDCVRDISMVKTLAGETLQDIVRDCLQLHGGAGYMQNCAIERLGRDARLMTIGGGATEVMLDEIAKRL